MTRRVGIYVRVSTVDQTVENQIRDLEQVALRAGWNVVEIFRDEGFSGAAAPAARPALKRLLLAVARKEVDLVAAWALDRIGRSLRDLVEILSEIHGHGADLFLYQQGIDTTTPAGKAMYQMLGVFAEFERGMIRERIRAGIDRAKANGSKFGRPAIEERKEARIREMIAAGASRAKIMLELGCGNAVITRLKEQIAAETRTPA